MIKKYRNNGAIGALLDEYEKAVQELDALISGINTEQLVTVADEKTEDADCRSIQTVLTHVVRAGYNYVVEIRRSLGETLDFMEIDHFDSAREYRAALKEMFAYNEQLFTNYPTIALEQYASEKKILVRWGQRYDIEQLVEHAIVHILRHRRQIERFLISVKSN